MGTLTVVSKAGRQPGNKECSFPQKRSNITQSVKGVTAVLSSNMGLMCSSADQAFSVSGCLPLADDFCRQSSRQISEILSVDKHTQLSRQQAATLTSGVARWECGGHHAATSKPLGVSMASWGASSRTVPGNTHTSLFALT